MISRPPSNKALLPNTEVACTPAPHVIDMEPVTSSNVEAVGYHAASQTLAVRFKGGATYHYGGVSPDLYAALKTASSVGSHFHMHIRSRFEGKKQEPAG